MHMYWMHIEHANEQCSGRMFKNTTLVPIYGISCSALHVPTILSPIALLPSRPFLSSYKFQKQPSRSIDPGNPLGQNVSGGYRN